MTSFRTLNKAITSLTSFDGDYLNLSCQNLSEINEIPNNYKTITKLNIAHNKLKSFDGISQFKELTHLIISHNLFEDIKEFLKISSPEKILVLKIENNPVSLNPNILPILINIFPHLTELDNVKIQDYIKQDIIDSIVLSKNLMKYLYKNEQLIIKLDKDIKIIKIKFEMFQKLRISAVHGPY